MNNRVGEKYVTNEGYTIEIIEYLGVFNCTIKFNDYNNTILTNRVYDAIKGGRIRNPNHKSTYGIGYFGQGIYSSKNNVKIYKTWSNIIKRCYDENYHEKKPTYKGCIVVEHWQNFQNFAKWYEENWKLYMEGWHLDKDILVKGNKIYSPETCCFVPQEINALFTKRDSKRGDCVIGVHYNKRDVLYGVHMPKNKKGKRNFKTEQEAFKCYKFHKEEYIKEIADKWKDIIDPRVYEAMYDYQIEITD